MDTEAKNIASDHGGSPMILVAGAGIAGIHASVELAGMGHRVLLTDKAPFIGGILTQLDHQFPDNHCGMCRMLPMLDRDGGPQTCMRRGLFHERITLMPLTEIVAVEGSPGRLEVELRTTPSGILQDRCTGCGSCEGVCPVEVPDAFNAGLSRRKAVYTPVPHQAPLFRTIDWQACTGCGACVDACPTEAVRLDGSVRTTRLDTVAAVLLTEGATLFDPRDTDLYGFGRLANVVTASGLERIMSGSGPFQGRLLRPSDQAPARRIAWIQCVGSRNLAKGADYCSNICCMFALKEALLAKEKMGATGDAAIFYMDLRSFGRDYQRYRDRVEKAGVRLIRCRIHSLQPHADTDDITVSYVDDQGRLQDEIFDLAVLSTGKSSGRAHPDWSRKEGVIRLHDIPEITDIGETVIRSGAAGGEILTLLKRSGLPRPSPDSKAPPKEETAEQKPRLLIVILGSGAGTAAANRENLEQHLRPRLHSTDILFLDSPGDLARAAAKAADIQANRLLLAGPYSALAMRPLLEELEIQTGLPRMYLDAADLGRPDVPAEGNNQRLQAAAMKIVMAAGQLLFRLPAVNRLRPVNRTALVVGGGPAGLAAALALAQNDVPVTLVEKEAAPGGNLANILDPEIRAPLEKLVNDVMTHPLVSVHCRSEIRGSFGRPGQFTTRFALPSGEERSVFHGVCILATGGGSASTAAYARGEHDRIVTVYEFENLLYGSSSPLATTAAKRLVMIQCVDSREEPRNYCSRICCLKSLKTALRFKQVQPRAEVIVFYRDMMTYGESETVYTEARRQGIRFIPFDPGKKPLVRIDDGTLTVEGFDPILGEPVHLESDWIVLAAGLIPHPDRRLGDLFQLTFTQDGFVQEADSKWRPLDTGREGVFICGLARGPVRADEALREGRAAAMRAMRLLCRDTLRESVVTARVRPALCSACEACIPVCAYHARYVDKNAGHVMVDPAACQGCGACAAVCPNNAAVLGGLETRGIMEAIGAALET
ncbi:MAG: 4Fe-4S binding protein [Thermodesulfobacteriota bacterium]